MEHDQSLVRTHYTVRSAAFLYCFAMLGVHLWQHAATLAAWGVLALQFLVYPHLLYGRALRSADPTRAELDNLYIDAALLGAWSAWLGFPAWISYAFIGGAAINAAVNRGPQGALWSAACSAAGAALWIAIGGFGHGPGLSEVVTLMCASGSVVYLCAIGCVVHAQNRGLAAARDEVRRSEERYRLIAENAADLIAMIDREGRWLYCSPSYEHVLDPADLKPGIDAFRRVHPDDAERARVAMARAAATGKPRELALRLVDRAGRIRQYKTRLQALGDGAQSERLLLVSHDVTDLRESEERLLLAAHALEGMTEAIMITAADGTVLTVNRAFSEITGYTRDEVLGHAESEIRTALQPPEFYNEVYAIVGREGYWSGTTWCRRKNGSVYREWRSVRAVRDGSGILTHYVIVFYEVDAQRSPAEAQSGA